jgi:hypothetical protein
MADQCIGIDKMRIYDIHKFGKRVFPINLLKYSVIFTCILSLSFCSKIDNESAATVKITISVRDEIVVNKDTVSIDRLDAKLKQIGITKGINIQIVPDPEAGAATIEKVQRMVRLYKASVRDTNTD